jgi:outer membrane biosynthesis protein TonB
MSEQQGLLAIPDDAKQVLTRLDQMCSTVHGYVFDTQRAIAPVERLYYSAMISAELDKLLKHPVILKTLMSLKNEQDGFLTDERYDGSNQYSADDVVRCAKHAIKKGLRRLDGGTWMIFKRRCYITKEGLMDLCSEQVQNLVLIPGVPTIKVDTASSKAAGFCDMTATYTFRGQNMVIERKGPTTIAVPVALDKYGSPSIGPDAVIGKAKRRMLATILETISSCDWSGVSADMDDTGEEVIQTARATVVDSRPATPHVRQEAPAPRPAQTNLDDLKRELGSVKAAEDRDSELRAAEEKGRAASVPPPVEEPKKEEPKAEEKPAPKKRSSAQKPPVAGNVTQPAPTNAATPPTAAAAPTTPPAAEPAPAAQASDSAPPAEQAQPEAPVVDEHGILLPQFRRANGVTAKHAQLEVMELTGTINKVFKPAATVTTPKSGLYQVLLASGETLVTSDVASAQFASNIRKQQAEGQISPIKALCVLDKEIADKSNDQKCFVLVALEIPESQQGDVL